MPLKAAPSSHTKLHLLPLRCVCVCASASADVAKASSYVSINVRSNMAGLGIVC